MIGLDATRDAPATARYHRDVVEQIIECVNERVYCTLLGPRLCGKTLLLRYIEHNMARLLGWTCIYIDLLEVRTTTQQAFFSDLIQRTAGRLSDLTGSTPSMPKESEASSAVFRAFLADCLDMADRDLVLMIDPLEALPADLVEALLTSLRAAYMDQQNMDNQLTVVVSGALSLASVAMGESSPFRGIARQVIIGDLSESDSQALIWEFLVDYGVSATQPALDKLRLATLGDTYLIRRISERCAELVLSRSAFRVRSRDVDQVTSRFLRDEVFQYAPLVDAVRLIEEDPNLLHSILRLIEEESVPSAELSLPLSPDLDPLSLTGVVDRIDGNRYRLQNRIYRQFLTQHFTPGRVGHVLSMVGRWDSAIDYLEASALQGDRQSRQDLLPATINSMYAAQDLAQAAYFLRRGLSAAFGVGRMQVWFSPPQEKHLIAIGPADAGLNKTPLSNQSIPHDADRLEARAFRHSTALRGQESERRAVRAIPLLIPGRMPIGVATIMDDLAGLPSSEQRERDLQLVGFLNQAARALQAVSLRRQELALAGRVQASLLPEAPPQLPGWQIAATWRPARETSGDFYDFIPLPKGKMGILIADVVDKGMGAALLMTLSRTLIRTYAHDYPDNPEGLLQAVNQRIIADIQFGPFVTLFYAVLDPTTGKLSYANAGHPPPLMLPVDKSQEIESLQRTGMPLGISEENSWERASVHIPPGALLLMYTDGISEAFNPQGELFGEAQILHTIRKQQGQPALAIQEALLSSVFAFAGTEPQLDDITLLVLVR